VGAAAADGAGDGLAVADGVEDGLTGAVCVGTGLGAVVGTPVAACIGVAAVGTAGDGEGIGVLHAAHRMPILAATLKAKTHLLMGGLYLSVAPLSTCFDNRPRQPIMDCRVVATASLPRHF